MKSIRALTHLATGHRLIPDDLDEVGAGERHASPSPTPEIQDDIAGHELNTIEPELDQQVGTAIAIHIHCLSVRAGRMIGSSERA